ncbi:polyprotein [Phytophthora megakarya]|uniref:Polyprotein n=1 Tax=Phytophthora megakarya TaxID=4795 RepID=A0A225WCU4_9STRA|nr:polyprotein [Phytophthora megakarya]
MLWGEAALHVVYTLNVTATRVLGGLTPNQKLSGVQPDVSGSQSKKKKLSSRMGTSIFVGHSPSTYGYKVMDLANGAISIHRGSNLDFADGCTVGHEYVELLLGNTYLHGANALPSRAPLVPMLMQIAHVVK